MVVQGQISPEAQVLGVRFFQGAVEAAADRALSGGLTVAPSGPGMADDLRNRHYATAVSSADLVMPDSGYMVLLWWLLRGERVARISGLALMRALVVRHASVLGRDAFWVMPSADDAAALDHYLGKCRISCDSEQIYVAPFYRGPAIEDVALLDQLEQRRPPVVIIAIAGGKQEVLGAWLRDHLSYRPAIICIGAAIAFLSGRQTHIPGWADRFFLGWLLRLWNDPTVYGRRYFRALRLAWTLAR